MKKILLAAVMSVAFSTATFAGTGWNPSYNYIFNGSVDVFYDLNGTSQAAGNFNGANLGTFDASLGSGVGSSLFLNAEINAWQSDTDNYSNFSLWYRVYSGTPTGSFTQVSAPSLFNPGGGGDGDRRGLATGVNLLTDRSNGTYTLETYLSRTFTWDGGGPLTSYLRVGGDQFDAPTSNFFSATFEVVPEPSTYALLSLAAAGLGAHVMRRRRLRK